MLTSIRSVSRSLRRELFQIEGRADAQRDGDAGGDQQHQGRPDHGAQHAGQFRLGGVALGEQAGVEAGGDLAVGLHPVQPVDLLVRQAALVGGRRAADLALEIQVGVVRQPGRRSGTVWPIRLGLAADAVGGGELQLGREQAAHGRRPSCPAASSATPKRRQLLLGDQQLEIGALRIGRGRRGPGPYRPAR